MQVLQTQNEVKEIFGYFEQKGNALCYRYESERLIIEPWGENSLRVRSTPAPLFSFSYSQTDNSLPSRTGGSYRRPCGSLRSLRPDRYSLHNAFCLFETSPKDPFSVLFLPSFPYSVH